MERFVLVQAEMVIFNQCDTVRLTFTMLYLIMQFMTPEYPPRINTAAEGYSIWSDCIISCA